MPDNTGQIPIQPVQPAPQPQNPQASPNPAQPTHPAPQTMPRADQPRPQVQPQPKAAPNQPVSTIKPDGSTQPQPQPQRPPQQPPTKEIKIKSPHLAWKELQTTISKLEEKLGGKVLCYFTGTQIVGDDVKYFYSHLRSLGRQKKLFFVLYSSGGDGKSAYRIASLLKEYCDELIVIIPERAASAATMLSLAADELMMTPLAYFTAVDTSIVHPLNPKDHTGNPVRVELEEVRLAVEVLAKSSSKTKAKDNLEIYKTIFSYIHPAAFGAMERTTNLSEMLCRDILKLRRNPMEAKTAEKLINKLNHDYPAHGYPITREGVRELGLPVIDTDEEMNQLLWQYLNFNRYITEPQRTDFNDSAFHQETVINIIESTGRRIFVMNTLERRLDPIMKGWATLRDEYRWYSVSETMEDGKPVVRVSNMDL